MKKSIFTKMGAAAMVLTLVTASLVGGTFARYTSTVSGTANATVAKWAIAMKANNTEPKENKFEIALKNTNEAVEVAEDKIAPGASGTIKLEINGNGSEVGYTYTVKAEASGLEGIPLVFTDKEGNVVTISKSSDTLTTIESGEVALTNVGTAKEVILNWKWDDTSSNAADTSLGNTPPVGVLNFVVTAEQLDKPKETSPES